MDSLSQGTGTWADVTKYSGEWKNDDLWEGTEYDKDGSAAWTISEGVMEKVAN